MTNGAPPGKGRPVRVSGTQGWGFDGGPSSGRSRVIAHPAGRGSNRWSSRLAEAIPSADPLGGRGDEPDPESEAGHAERG